MLSALKKAAVASAVVVGSVVAADKADAQWGYGPSYGGSSFYFGINTGPSYYPSRYSFYTPSYSYGYGYGLPGRYGYTGVPSYAAPSYGYGYYGGPSYVRPRGRLEYDVYSPFGRSEVEYRFRRDGSVRVDVDD